MHKRDRVVTARGRQAGANSNTGGLGRREASKKGGSKYYSKRGQVSYTKGSRYKAISWR